MFGPENVCPRCKPERVSRRRRRATWMRRLPNSKHYECGNCETRFLSIFGGIIKLPLPRLRKPPSALPTAATLASQSPGHERGAWYRKVRYSITPVRVSVLILALGGLLIYQGFGDQARQAISRKYRQFLTSSSAPQAGPVSSEPKTSPPAQLVSTGTNLPKPATKPEVPAVPPEAGKSPPVNPPAQNAPLPAPKPVARAARFSEIMIKKGDSLGRILAHYYPNNQQIGLVAIILANPGIHKDNIIYSGQVLKVPKLDSQDKTFQLQDNLFYTFYASHYAAADLKKDTLWLNQQQVRFLVKSTKDAQGKNINRIILGGYETQADCAQALQRLKTK